MEPQSLRNDLSKQHAIALPFDTRVWPVMPNGHWMVLRTALGLGSQPEALP